jgi:predicted CXXCH cytochrome family protein
VAVSALGGSTTGASTTTITGAGLISTDLSTTHPVSMTYSGGAGYEPDPEGTNGLPLYTGNKVQCGSCHDPHLNTPGPMIRPTGLDTVCLGCHIK